MKKLHLHVLHLGDRHSHGYAYACPYFFIDVVRVSDTAGFLIHNQKYDGFVPFI